MSKSKLGSELEVGDFYFQDEGDGLYAVAVYVGNSNNKMLAQLAKICSLSIECFIPCKICGV